MDVSMPELNGLQATRKLKEKCPQVKVLPLTRHTDDGYLQQLLQAGACGYVLKQSKSVELLRAIRAVAVGQTYLDPAIAGKAVTQIRSGKRTARGVPPNANLSDREAEVLRLIAWGHVNKEWPAPERERQDRRSSQATLCGKWHEEPCRHSALRIATRLAGGQLVFLPVFSSPHLGKNPY